MSDPTPLLTPSMSRPAFPNPYFVEDALQGDVPVLKVPEYSPPPIQARPCPSLSVADTLLPIQREDHLKAAPQLRQDDLLQWMAFLVSPGHLTALRGELRERATFDLTMIQALPDPERQERLGGISVSHLCQWEWE